MTQEDDFGAQQYTLQELRDYSPLGEPPTRRMSFLEGILATALACVIAAGTTVDVRESRLYRTEQRIKERIAERIYLVEDMVCEEVTGIPCMGLKVDPWGNPAVPDYSKMTPKQRARYTATERAMWRRIYTLQAEHLKSDKELCSLKDGLAATRRAYWIAPPQYPLYLP